MGRASWKSLGVVPCLRLYLFIIRALYAQMTCTLLSVVSHACAAVHDIACTLLRALPVQLRAPACPMLRAAAAALLRARTSSHVRARARAARLRFALCAY